MEWKQMIAALTSLALAAVPVIAGKVWYLIEERIKASMIERLGLAT